MTYFPENATVFTHDADPKLVAAARERGEHVMVLPKDPYWQVPHDRTPMSHAQDVANEARNLILDKYVKGQREHGGELWRKTGIIDMAIDEAVDQVVYLLTLRDQIRAAGVTLGDLSE